MNLGPLLNSTILDLIGNTPLVALGRCVPAGSATILGKLESRNPTGSVKDRVALAMVQDAEAAGRLLPGSTLLEPTSGNTGLALAMVAAAKGYPLIVAAPEGLPSDRRRLLIRMGARLHLTPMLDGMGGAVRAVERLLQENPSYVTLRQFSNPANADVHRRTTAQEILRDAGGEIDALVAGVGTGGTITGVGEVLKGVNPRTLVVAVEPAASPLLSKGFSADHGIPGLGADFVPDILNRSIIDEVVGVTEEQAYETTARLAREEGLLVGISSGASVFAALQVAERLGPGKRVVVILPDGGERYGHLQL